MGHIKRLLANNWGGVHDTTDLTKGGEKRKHLGGTKK